MTDRRSRGEARVAIVETRAGRLHVLAPSVGLWTDPPRRGDRLGRGSGMGTLTMLQRSHYLVLPEETGGVVTRVASAGQRLAVEYRQELMVLDAAPVESGGEGRPPDLPDAVSTTGLPAGAQALVSPTDGVFYSRPAPDLPPFVEPGARIRTGQPVGLVEVMKTFNQILYDGAALPPSAQVIEIRVADGDEVAAGQVLLVVRRAD